MVFAHGFGCDQTIWRYVAPAFEDRWRVILLDHVGAGSSRLDAYDPARYTTLDAYATDLLEVCAALAVTGGVFVGHSVGAMIGVLAAIAEPDRFERLVLIGPSPCYVDDGDYVGGFSRQDIDELLAAMDDNYLGWSSAIGPTIVGNAERPELGAELTNSLCATDPDIARQFARVTFLSDNRADLPRVPAPTLVLQCSDDPIAPASVGAYVAQAIPDGTLRRLRATGHCPHLSAPAETVAAIEEFL